ncbi:hypothetical protein ACROYT_G017776 [Oculina patagonica]
MECLDKTEDNAVFQSSLATLHLHYQRRQSSGPSQAWKGQARPIICLQDRRLKEATVVVVSASTPWIELRWSRATSFHLSFYPESLFAGYRSTNPGTSTYPKRSETKSLPPAKRSRPSGGGYYRVRETWTREFLCMANKDVEAVPTKADKLTLLAAGLGRKKLTFGNKDDAPTFKRKMEDAYPKLKQGGGFDLLRSGVRPGELLLVKVAQDPCSLINSLAKFLDEVLSCKAFIRYILNIDSSKIYQGYKGMMELHCDCPFTER